LRGQETGSSVDVQQIGRKQCKTLVDVFDSAKRAASLSINITLSPVFLAIAEDPHSGNLLLNQPFTNKASKLIINQSDKDSLVTVVYATQA